MNVPKLRFKDFTDECSTKKLKSICSFYSGGTPASTNKDFYSGNIPFIRSGEIHSENAELFVSEEAIKNSSAKYVEKGDLLLALYGATSGDIAISKINGVINQAILCIRPSKFYDKNYIKYIFESKKYKILNIYLQGGQGNLSADIIKNIKFDFCSFEEQTKIANFLSLLDKKIELQTKKIEALKLYKKGLSNNIFLNLKVIKEEKLGNLCNITTGKLDANAMVKNGTYRFYTCAKDYYHIDKYAFDTEALLISGNGAYVGYVHYYKGKFNAYQRTYVLDKFLANIYYIKIYLDEFLSRRIHSEKKEGNTPYIILSTLFDMKIKLTNPISEKKIINTFDSINKKIKLEKSKLDRLNELKKGLMQNMFV